jgi:hypothetical protein
MPLPKLRDRARRVLRYLSHETPNVEAWYDLRSAANDVELWGRSYSKDANEGIVLLQLLTQDGLLTDGGGVFHLSVDGLLAIEDMGANQKGTAQGFVAMWFDPSLNEAWLNGFDAAIRAAGYEPMRVDNKEYIGGISDEVMAEIRKSRFVVVDYTGQRNNVYFEAGFAVGLGLPVIPTCRADEAEKLGFDIRHMNTLTWTTPDDIAHKLKTRIEAVVGVGLGVL